VTECIAGLSAHLFGSPHTVGQSCQLRSRLSLHVQCIPRSNAISIAFEARTLCDSNIVRRSRSRRLDTLRCRTSQAYHLQAASAAAKIFCVVPTPIGNCFAIVWMECPIARSSFTLVMTDGFTFDPATRRNSVSSSPILPTAADCAHKIFQSGLPRFQHS
jgi:hypothetical protein